MKNSKLYYNYVFVTQSWSDLNIRYRDLNNTDYSKLIAIDYNDQKPKNSIIAFLYKVHTSNKINRIIKLPFTSIWKKYWIPDILDNILFNNANPICFIILARYFEYIKEFYRSKFIQHLREKYTNCKIVLYYTDISKSYSFNFLTYKQQFDSIVSFDKKDALNNNFKYYPEQFFSSYPIKENPSVQKSDIVFIGRGKNRMDEIISIFELLHNNNLKCDFYIVGVPPSEQKHKDKITYGKQLDYHDVLQRVVASKCILEILQDGGSSHTARVSEAIAYGKKILSNCRELAEKPCYNPKYISIFSNPNDIDIEFIKKDVGVIDYNYVDNLSPLQFVEFMEENNS